MLLLSHQHNRCGGAYRPAKDDMLHFLLFVSYPYLMVTVINVHIYSIHKKNRKSQDVHMEILRFSDIKYRNTQHI
ncbi:hypothetical protein MBAV_005173 [Candidatus Magnetobacterium bavaricum]|uniref:Uncharacterized protein n=1 Tax=Candidatus Magnetobacterium bavaricum TaxID=29290 RepID=A0A0F3GL39_9BACT|nr:hypothetical protein MBAV_005173 [Candidatus Magnetobacterium bavaricum]